MRCGCSAVAFDFFNLLKTSTVHFQTIWKRSMCSSGTNVSFSIIFSKLFKIQIWVFEEILTDLDIDYDAITCIENTCTCTSMSRWGRIREAVLCLRVENKSVNYWQSVVLRKHMPRNFCIYQFNSIKVSINHIVPVFVFSQVRSMFQHNRWKQILQPINTTWMEKVW